MGSTIPEPSKFSHVYENIYGHVHSVLTGLDNAFKISQSQEISELKDSLNQNLHLFESGKPARPAYEFINDVGIQIRYFEDRYGIMHGLRAMYYGIFTSFTVVMFSGMSRKLNGWEDEAYNKMVQHSKDLSQQTKTLLPEIYANLSAYGDRHIMFGVAYRFLCETGDADAAFKFLTSMRHNADAFFDDVSDLYTGDYGTLKQDPSSVLRVISREDVVGLVRSFSGTEKEQGKPVEEGRAERSKRELILDDNVVTFDSIGGYDKIKDELRLYVLALRNPYEAAMNGVQLETGIILWGSPGTGKTLLAQAFVHEALKDFGPEMQTHWEQISGADIKSKWVGVGEQNVKGLYARARKNPPYIIFIDEGDVLFQSRDEVHEYNREIITQFLTEMGGTRRSDRVTTVVTTNRMESFDTASTRYGRLGIKIQVDLPDEYGRRQIFDVHLLEFLKIIYKGSAS